MVLQSVNKLNTSASTQIFLGVATIIYIRNSETDLKQNKVSFSAGVNQGGKGKTYASQDAT